MKYDIICSTSVDELIKWVNEKLKQGWKLQGGVASGYWSNNSKRELRL